MAQLAILVAVALLAAPAAPAALKGKCNLACSSAGNRVKLQPGHVYTYNVESVATVALAGVDAQETHVRYDGEAKVFALDKCEFAVTVTRVTFHGADDKKFTPGDLVQQLARPVRFALGSPTVCTHTDDPAFSVNVKRAVASAFVNGGEDGTVTDTDVFGACPTVVSVSQTGAVTIVNRARNLNLCSKRESLGHTLAGSVFNEASGVKSTPSLNGDYSSEVRLKGGVVEHVQVDEEYRFVAFSTASAGARAKVVTKMSLTSSTKGAPGDLDASSVERSVTFETPHGGAPSAQRLRDTLRDLVDNLADGVSANATTQFVDMVRLLRDTSKNDIKTTYQTIVSKSLHERSDLARKIYLDALFRTATGDAVEAIIDLIHGRTFSVAEQRLALLSMNLVTSLDKDSVQAFAKLTPNTPNLLPEALLAAGTLVKKYCGLYECPDDVLDKVFDRFTAHLHQCQPRKAKEENMIVAALKGARNAQGYLGKKLLNGVLTCVRKDTKTRIRVAAIEALQGVACDKRANEALLSVLEDANLDAELRIEGYLALTHCPTPQLADRLQKLLDGEQTQQVGAFLTSHLASLRASTDPGRADARETLGRVRSTKKFPFDLRRFSHSRELSYAVDSLGLGASADASVIYSHSSFLPRSLKLNATGELFGNAFNLLDVSVRQGNLDSVLERYFGPKGLFSSKSPQELYDYFKATAQNAQAKAQSTMRGRRDVSKSDVQAFAKNLVLPNDVTKSDLDLDVSVKFLGNEMLFLSLGDDLPTTPEAVTATLQSLVKEFLDGATKFQRNFEAHALFVDGELAYPTAGGLPLRLAAHATGVLGVEASGAVDVRKLWRDAHNAPVQLKVVPSANVDVVGSMLVDAYAVTSGLQVSASVHSSTGADVRVTMLNQPSGVDVKVSMPRRKQEIFSVNHDVAFYNRERGHPSVNLPLRFTSKRHAFSGCFDQLHRYIGVTFCTDYNVTIPGNAGVAPFPLNGANRVGVWLEVDSHYHFAVTHSDRSADQQFVRFAFDTPDSPDKRTTVVALESATRPNIFVRASLVSPYRNLAAEAGLVNDNKEVALYAKANDQRSEYLAKVGFAKDESKREYTPILQLTTPSSRDNSALGYSVDGKIRVADAGDGATRYNLHDIRLRGGYFTSHPLAVSGSVVQKGTAFDTDLVVERSGERATVKGRLQFEANRVNLDVKVKGNWYANVLYKMSYQPTEVLNHLELDYGGSSSSSQRVMVKQHWKHKHTKYRLEELFFANEVQLSYLPLVARVNGEFVDGSKVNYDVALEYGQHEVSSKLNVLLNEKTKGDYDVKVDASVNRRSLHAEAKRVVQENTSKYTNRVSTSQGTQLELNALVGHRFSAQEADVEADAKAQFGKQPPYTANLEVKLQPQGGTAKGSFHAGKADLLTFTGKLDRKGNSQNGDFVVNVKEILEASGDFATVGNNGTAKVKLNVLKLSKTVNVVSNFVIDAPTYNVATEVLYDDRVTLRFDTRNRVDRQSFRSHNDVEVFTEKYVCNVEGAVDGRATDGVVTGQFNVVLPTGRKLSGSLKREVRPQGDGVRGTAELTVTDKMPNDKSRSLSVSSQLLNGKWSDKLFHSKHALVYKSLDSKDVHVALDVNHKASKGALRAVDAELSVSGSLFARTARVTVKVPEYGQDHADFSVSVKSDKDGELQLVGRYVVGGRARANEFDVTFTGTAVGGDKSRTLQVKTSGSFLTPQVERGVYDAKWRLMVAPDGRESTLTVAGVANEDHANVKLDLKLHERDPVSVALTYSHEESEAAGKCHVDAVVSYAKDKRLHAEAVVKRTEGREVDLHATLDTPYEKAQRVEVNVKAAKTESSLKTAADVTVNKDKYGLNSALVLSDANPSVDLVVVYPKQTVRLFAGFARVGEKKYNGKVTVSNLMDYNVDATGEVSAASIDNFSAKLDVDAPKLKLNKFHGELKSKHQGASKGVEVLATNDGRTILTGFADYTVEQNRTLTVFEAKGDVKYLEKKSEAHLKFIHHTLTEAVNQETGVSFIVNAQLGPKSIVGELKLTDKNVQLKHTACEKQRQCINLDVQSTIFQADLDSFRHQVVVSVDLRKLGYSHEFGLKAETNRSGVELDHTIEMHLQAQDKPQYQYSMYLHSKSAGVVVTLPERTIALEGVFQRPETFFGQWDVSGTLHLDKKNKPHEAVSVGLKATTSEPSKGAAAIQSALTFAHPAVRPLSVKAVGLLDAKRHTADVTVHLDVFKTTANEITFKAKVENTESGRAFNVSSDVSLTSRQGIDYRAAGHVALVPQRRSASFHGDASVAGVSGSALFLVTSSEFAARVSALGSELFVAEGRVDKNNKLTTSATLRPLESTPITMKANLHGLTEAGFHLQRPNLVTVDAEFAINRAATFKMNSHTGDIFTAQVTLDQQHFLASKYQMNSDKMRLFLKEVQKTVQEDLDKAKQHVRGKFDEVKKRVTQQVQQLQKAVPDLDVVGKKVREELTSILQELEKDPSIKPVIEAVARVCGVVGKAFADIFQVTVQNLQKINEIVMSFYFNLMDIFNTRILPSLTEWYSAVENILHSVYLDTIQLLSGTLERVSKALKDYEEDFNKVAKVSSETVGKFVRGVSDFMSTMRKEVMDIQRLVLDYVASLPGVDVLKGKYNELFAQYNIPEHVVSLLREFKTVVRDTVPSVEIQEFIDALLTYVEAKLEGKDVNDLDLLKQMYVKGVTAAKAVIQIVKSQPSDVTSTLNVAPGGVPLPFSLDVLRRVPYISSVRFSPLNYVRNERWPTPRDVMESLTPNGRLQLHLLPPFPLAAHVVDGEHVFTFDGRHFTFPGDCSYVLTRDALHGNFTVVATMAKHHMVAVTLMDGSGVSVRVEVGGVVKVNDKVADLPVHQEDVHAWRRYYTVSALSRAGVHVMCTTDLVICHVRVSGYYRDRLRGLLGNGNGEPSDDFQLPDGSLAANHADFGNAYGLGACTPVAATHVHGHTMPVTEPCAGLFNSDPTLRLAGFVNEPANYREACQHAVTDAEEGQKMRVACNIVSAYVSAARLDGLPVSVPDKCLTCSDNRQVGQTFTTKTPSKAADVVFVVDTSLPLLLTDFTHQLTVELRKELRAFDMADVNVAVIGFERHQRYTSHFTHNGKLDVHGKLVPRDATTTPRCDLHLHTGFERVDELLEQWANATESLAEDLGLSADARAFQEAMAYPFRAKAAKIIFAVRSDPLTHSRNPSKSLTAQWANAQVKRRGVQVHLLSPVSDFTISGKDVRGVTAKDIVGFSQRTVIQTQDAKKRANPGQTTWRKAIRYTDDLGVQLTQDADGFVFLLQNYVSASAPKQRKQFVGAVAVAVADHAARHETHVECECRAAYGLHAEEKCTVTEVKLLKQVTRMQKG
uniref:Putative apolipophorins n=1 Tax=Phlebotomus kandelakii TaxID=1109342 RepID=A0A6B2E804_9DIPT